MHYSTTSRCILMKGGLRNNKHKQLGNNSPSINFIIIMIVLTEVVIKSSTFAYVEQNTLAGSSAFQNHGAILRLSSKEQWDEMTIRPHCCQNPKQFLFLFYLRALLLSIFTVKMDHWGLPFRSWSTLTHNCTNIFYWGLNFCFLGL